MTQEEKKKCEIAGCNNYHKGKFSYCLRCRKTIKKHNQEKLK